MRALVVVLALCGRLDVRGCRLAAASGDSGGRLRSPLSTLNSPNVQPPDSWFAPDKAKHFFTAAFVQTASFGGLRAMGASHRASLAGATAVTAAVSIGKELYDRQFGGDPSWKDLAWDAAGLLVASAMLHQTKP